ncbi:MAG: glutaredoxin [Bacteroidetes bacterium]|nr:glutaredoxin [Bacteroidota bacterium]
MKYALSLIAFLMMLVWISCQMGQNYQPAELIVYTKDGCPRCAEAKEILHARGRVFIEKNISNPQNRDSMWDALHQKSGGESVRLVMPVVVVDGQLYYNLPDIPQFFSGI